MSAVKVLFYLMAIVHGGPDDAFSMTRLGVYPDAQACDAAAKTTNGAIQAANHAGSVRFEVGCIPGDRIDALRNR